MVGYSVMFLISELHRAAVRRCQFITVKYSIFCLCILQRLYELGLINFYTVSCFGGKKFIIVGLRFLSGIPCIRSVQQLGGKTRGFPLSFKLIRSRYNSEPGCYMFFLTVRGVFLLEELFRYRLGGYPLLVVRI